MKREQMIDWKAVLWRATGVIRPGDWYDVDETAGLLAVPIGVLHYHAGQGNLPGRRREREGRAVRKRVEFLGREIIRWCREQARYAPVPRAA